MMHNCGLTTINRYQDYVLNDLLLNQLFMLLLHQGHCPLLHGSIRHT